jgi:hypothetical protein
MTADEDDAQCSGENPCQRCVDNGKRCFYSEDQTAAEVLQNLSRPTPGPSSLPLHSNGNGNGVPRRNILPRTETAERRASDASVTNLTMEARMARIEAMMEALMHDRGLSFNPGGGIEREGSEGFRSESAFSMPILDPIHPALDQLAQQQSPERMLAPALATSPTFASDSTAQVRAGNRLLPFPNPERYQQYVAHFFGHVHLRHPCVDELDFDAHTQRVVTEGATEPSDGHFLALCYAIFACCDAALDLTPPASGSKPPGWHWHQLAHDIVHKNVLAGTSRNLALIQCLLFQVAHQSHAAENPIDSRRLFTSRSLICLRWPTAPYAQHVQPSWSKIYISNQRGLRLTPSKYTGASVFSGMCTLRIDRYRYPAEDRLLFRLTI